jgi:hypothetical protein
MGFSAGHFGPGGSPRIYAGKERFSAPEKAALYQCALALETDSGARAATLTTQCCPSFSISLLRLHAGSFRANVASTHRDRLRYRKLSLCLPSPYY